MASTTDSTSINNDLIKEIASSISNELESKLAANAQRTRQLFNDTVTSTSYDIDNTYVANKLYDEYNGVIDAKRFKETADDIITSSTLLSASATKPKENP